MILGQRKRTIRTHWFLPSPLMDDATPSDVPLHRNLPIKLVIALAVLGIAGAVAFFGTQKCGGPLSQDFGMNQKVAAQSVLRMSFPEIMDARSVEEHLDVPSDIAGEIHWEGNVLVFDPSASLEKDRSYVFRVDRKAEKADDTPLGKDLEFTFTVTGDPMVVMRIPAENAVDID